VLYVALEHVPVGGVMVAIREIEKQFIQSQLSSFSAKTFPQEYWNKRKQPLCASFLLEHKGNRKTSAERYEERKNYQRQ
jgi:hypothetical protein